MIGTKSILCAAMVFSFLASSASFASGENLSGATLELGSIEFEDRAPSPDKVLALNRVGVFIIQLKQDASKNEIKELIERRELKVTDHFSSINTFIAQMEIAPYFADFLNENLNSGVCKSNPNKSQGKTIRCSTSALSFSLSLMLYLSKELMSEELITVAAPDALLLEELILE